MSADHASPMKGGGEVKEHSALWGTGRDDCDASGSAARYGRYPGQGKAEGKSIKRGEGEYARAGGGIVVGEVGQVRGQRVLEARRGRLRRELEQRLGHVRGTVHERLAVHRQLHHIKSQTRGRGNRNVRVRR